MTDPTMQPARTPWHVWVVGGISLLWNAAGALDFVMTQTRNEAYLKAFTPEQLDYFHGFPLWVVLAWGVATWGSMLGSVLLLLRRKLAVPVNLAVLVAMALTFLHNFILTDGMKIMAPEGKGPWSLRASSSSSPCFFFFTPGQCAGAACCGDFIGRTKGSSHANGHRGPAGLRT